ncbi:MAG: DegV family protein, partial [Candidatus Heimdallarchaeota archaeon]
MKIRLVTDTAADLPREISEKYDIVIIPHIITIDDRNLKLGVDISIEELYNKMKTMDIIPRSSTPTPQDFLVVFQESFEKLGYDHIIYIAVAEKLTATLSVARIAAKDFKDKITLFDTESASGVQGLMLIAVLNMLEDNIPLEVIIKKLKE